MIAPAGGRDQAEVTIRPPAHLAGRRCYQCDTQVKSPRVECAPGVDLCVYCADEYRGHIVTTFPGARVIMGDTSFHLGQNQESAA